MKQTAANTSSWMAGRDGLTEPFDEMSLCFDRESGTLHKHGKKEWVAKWHANAVKKYSDAGFHDMAAELVVITGRFPLEEINKCLSNSTYCEVFYRKLMAGEVAALPYDYGEPAAPRA